MKSFLISITAGILFFSGCRKAPGPAEACMTVNKTEVSQGEQLIFSNCSKAESATLIIFEKGGKPIGEGYSFSQKEKECRLSILFPGTFTALLQAHNGEGTAVQTMTMGITVKP